MPVERAAGDPTFHELVQRQVALLSTKGWYHSIELPDGHVIQGMIGIEALKERLAAFPIPADLTGKRVLDVGAWTGWCSFEMERRGAQVVAVDCVEFEEFREAHRMIGSQVDYRILDVEELTPESVGLFDYVLFFGVLYHLRNPLLGLEKICAITRDTAFVESFVTDDGSAPCSMEFYETDQLGGQIDNWFGPSVQCAEALCRSAGFAHVNLEYVSERRAGITCRRCWEPPPPDPAEAAPLLYSAVNNRTNDIHFHPGKDEYICVYFRSDVPDLTRDRLRIEVDEFGAPVLVLANQRAQEWQANLRVPPGLAAGPHQVRLRTADSPYSNPFQISVSPWRAGFIPRGASARPAEPRDNQPSPVIYEVTNGMTESPIFHGHRNEYVCCRFRTTESALDRDRVILNIDDGEQPLLFLTDLGYGCWQANSRLPAGLGEGKHSVRIRTLRSAFGSACEIFFRPAGS
jgi:tRNA (mo5U34)-methyltransferase